MNNGLILNVALEDDARTVRSQPKGQTLTYQRPYPAWFDLVALPNNYRIPEFSKFTGQDSTSTLEPLVQMASSVAV